MRRFLIGWILIVLLLPFAAAWIYSEWSEKNQQIEQESSQEAVYTNRPEIDIIFRLRIRG